ncbi:aspartate/glutamate racemase family protein [Altererythrobacter fulvus]|uniref:aspartate/glutamate racemase family protein n=1 Tax=Caenibius fulvus TaxID=2126012 RepID=UPI00301B2C9E
MRKLGLIGGMSWISTSTYYDRINRYVQARVPAPASAPLLLESLDFSLVYRVTEDQGWEEAAKVVTASAQRLEQAGAGALVICANSMHKVYDEVAASVDIPIFHIAECVGEKMKADGVTTAALFGTRNVMTESFYRKRLVAHGVDLLPPDMDYVEQLDRIIYDELMLGKVTRDAQRKLKTMITVKEQAGARAIVLACTELDMVVDIDANVLPIYDSLKIHAEKAAEWILGEG